MNSKLLLRSLESEAWVLTLFVWFVLSLDIAESPGPCYSLRLNIIHVVVIS
jgi:hypothetical protein